MNRELWDSLPEFEQFAIACSSNVFERNKQYHLDFNNRVLFNKNTTEGYEILNENWGIYNTEELLQSYKELAEGEQGALYNRLKALLEKYPDLTVLEIAEKERLTVTETSRMYFVEDMREALGVHGLQAWLDARKIAILRWGIGAGYITREQAVELIVPIVERIKNDYKNYEEFIAHFIAGYCFNAVYDSNCPDCAEKLISAVSSARKYIPFDTLPFTGINADKNYTMQIDDATYYPSITALKLDPIQKLYKKSSNENVLEQLDEEVEKYPEAQTLVIPFKLRQLYNYASASKVIDYIHANKEYIDSYPKESAGYTELATIYMVDLIKVFRPEEAIALYNSLPESLQKEEGYYYSYGYANYQLSFLCSTVLERDIYIRRAKTVFERLLARNYDLGESVQNWLEAVE